MIQTVFKYQLGFSAANHITMPKGAKIAMVAMQTGSVTMWAVVPIEFTETETRDFVVAGTGHPVEGNAEHIGSCVDNAYVWHVFEMLDA